MTDRERAPLDALVDVIVADIAAKPPKPPAKDVPGPDPEGKLLRFNLDIQGRAERRRRAERKQREVADYLKRRREGR